VVELGDKMGLSLPCTKAVYACVKLLAQNTLAQPGKTG
jgi:ketopantoate reductase